MDDFLLTPVEAALRLRVSTRTLTRWRVRGDGPAYVRCGRLARYRVSDLAAWVNARPAWRSTVEEQNPGAAG